MRNERNSISHVIGLLVIFVLLAFFIYTGVSSQFTKRRPIPEFPMNVTCQELRPYLIHRLDISSQLTCNDERDILLIPLASLDPTLDNVVVSTTRASFDHRQGEITYFFQYGELIYYTINAHQEIDLAARYGPPVRVGELIDDTLGPVPVREYDREDARVFEFDSPGRIPPFIIYISKEWLE